MRRPAASTDRPLLALVLPCRLGDFALRGRAEDLLSAPGAVAVEPARVSYGTLATIPSPAARSIARRQARRMRLPGVLRAVAVFHPFQYPLARALLARSAECELWYAGSPPAEEGSASELHHLAFGRAALIFAAGGPPQPLWERMAQLGIA